MNPKCGVCSVPDFLALEQNFDFGELLEYVAKYATKEAVDEAGEDSSSEDELSSVGSYESDREEPAGEMDDV